MWARGRRPLLRRCPRPAIAPRALATSDPAIASQVLQTGVLAGLAHAAPISVGNDEVLLHRPFGGEYALHLYDRNADLPPTLPPRYASLGIVPSTGLGDPWPGGALARAAMRMRRPSLFMF